MGIVMRARLTVLPVLAGERCGLVDAAGEHVGHDIAALTVSQQRDLAVRSAVGDVVLDLLNCVVDAVRHGCGV